MAVNWFTEVEKTASMGTVHTMYSEIVADMANDYRVESMDREKVS